MIKQLKKYGLIGTYKRLLIHLSIKRQIEYKNNNGIYTLKKKNNLITPKYHEVNIFTNKIDNKKIEELNQEGYGVNLYTKPQEFENILAVKSINFLENIKEEKIEYLSNKEVNKKIDLSIAILNYNNYDCIFKAIESLLKYNSYNYKIIVIDNNSSDNSYQELMKNYSEKIEIYRNNKNGCSSGRNLAISKIKTQYTMFLDSDQYSLSNNWLDNYIDIFEKEKNIGAVGWACGWFQKNNTTKHYSDAFLFRYMPPYGLFREDIGYLGTGGMLLKTEVLKEVSGFDEKYDPTGYEDTDFSIKIREKGYRLIYCPYLNIFHDAHQSTKSGSVEHQKLLKRNSTYFKNKWKNKKELLIYKK